jgi:hypothetical protein
MTWEYQRKELHDKRIDQFLADQGAAGWELIYAHRGKATRVNSDPDMWEVILKRPKGLSPANSSWNPPLQIIASTKYTA